jgi:hypothetical protein
MLKRPLTGKRKRTEDRLAEEAKKFFGEPFPVTPSIEITPENLEPASIYQTQRVLNRIALHPEALPVFYTTVLRGFLERMGITWFDKAYRYNPISPGSGRKPSALGAEAARLKCDGKSWSEVAKTLLPEEYTRNKKAASDKVRLAAQRYSNTTEISLRRKT